MKYIAVSKLKELFKVRIETGNYVAGLCFKARERYPEFFAFEIVLAAI